MRAPHVFTISPALPFLDTFVGAFLSGEILPGITSGLDLADATIYVPTQRAAQALADTFLRRIGGASVVLPRILPLGALEGTEASLLLTEPDPLAAGLPLPPAASPVWRRLRLGVLIQAWSRSIDGALQSVGADGLPRTDPREAFRVATSAVDAFALASDLADLIDELRIEGVAWHELDELRMAGFDAYWRLTTHFLSIAFDAWPKMLAEAGLIDPSARQMALVEAQTRQLGDGSIRRPVLAIGSTGSSRATARLLAAIARAPVGAVVLPGLDRELDEAAWRIIAPPAGKTVSERQDEPCFTHPQAAMARLLPILGVERDAVMPLGAPAPEAARRARFVAEALRPADTTDQWRAVRKDLTDKALRDALGDVTLVEAADEREEALAIALALRETLERPDATAALVTPDRDLARRVRGELLRWNVEVDDSGGEPLANRPAGVVIRLVAAAAAAPRAAARTAAGAQIGALLAHPLATFGRPRTETAHRARQIDVAVLNVVPLDGRPLAEVFDAARTIAAEPHAHPAQKRLRDDDWTAMQALLTDVREALSPLGGLTGEHDIGEWVVRHRRAVAAVMAEAAEDELEAIEALFDELLAGEGSLRLDAHGYGQLLDGLLREVVLRNTDRPHPRLQILGLLEARLMTADLMILGGLDETVWPPPARTDPFLNRPMRQELGLSPPERRIGQTAHDFTQAFGARRVLLTRAEKRGGTPCVPSRFLLRLAALGGKAWVDCRVRGQAHLDLTRDVDRTPGTPRSAKRPYPTPPLDLRPNALSVTAIETLRRDPYAIFAAHVLRLKPLPRLPDDFDARDYGNRLHEVLHGFSHDPAARGDRDQRRTALLTRLDVAFAADRDDPAFAAFRWPLVLKAADVFLSFDHQRRRQVDEILTEIRGTMTLPLADGSTFTLSARADRIDFDRDGSAMLIDYKTGQVPGLSEVEVGFAPQLTLEAAILKAGGFPRRPSGSVGATYLRLGGRDGGLIRHLDFKDAPFDAVVSRHVEGLRQLLSSFRVPTTGYPSRLFPKMARRDGDYDHLARVREWDLATDEEAQS